MALGEENRGFKVEGPDGYRGWVRSERIHAGDLPDPVWKVKVPWAPVRGTRTGKTLGFLPLDARFFGEERGRRLFLRFPSGEEGWLGRKAALPANWRGTNEDVLKTAQDLVGIPYLWGGTTPFGFDCSGFVQRLFHFVFNLWLPRDSHDQKGAGLNVGDFAAMHAGDLVCFPGHVALHLGNGRIVHASGRFGQVVVTDLTSSDPYARELRERFLCGVRVQTCGGAREAGG